MSIEKAKRLFPLWAAAFGCAVMLATTVQADHFDGDAGAGDPSWNTATNWALDAVPTSGEGTVQAINFPGYGVVVNNPGATASEIHVGTWGWNGSLDVAAAGTLSVVNHMLIAAQAGGTGTVVNAGQINAGGTLFLASAGHGTFNMNGGTVTVGTLDLVQPGIGHLNLHGGTIYAPALNVNGNATNTIDITEGTLITSGDRTTGLNWMASIGVITAYGGEGDVYAEYNASSNQTTLFASPITYGAVAVENGSFTDKKTGAQFFPVGFNYIDLRTNNVPNSLLHDTFNPSRYDDAVVSSNLAEIATAGFNTVRVFIDSGVSTNGVVLTISDTELSPAYMQNVASFLEQAHAHNIYVLITFSHFPATVRYYSLTDTVANVGGMNQHYLNPGFIDAMRLFMRDFIQTLTQLTPDRLADTVFAFDPQNECCHYLNVPPFSLSSGTVTPANGVTYDLATDKLQLADEMAVYWTDQMAEEIHLQALGTPVDVNVFTYAAVWRSIGDFSLYGTTNAYDWRDRYPFRPEALAASGADFMDIHFYTGDAADLQADLDSIEFSATASAWNAVGRPMIVGEFGAFKNDLSFSEAVDWKGDEVDVFAVNGFQGWLYWTYENDLQTSLWHAVDGAGEIFDALAQGAQANYPATQFKHSGIQSDGTSVHVNWDTVAGKNYQLLRSISLTDPYWKSTGNPVAGTGSTVSNSAPASADQRFYKVRVNR